MSNIETHKSDSVRDIPLAKTQLDSIKRYLPSHLARDVSNEMDDEKLLTILIHLASVQYTLSTYLPRYLVSAVKNDPKPGQVSGGFRYGTALFADVSGFTAMSEKLSTLGKEGAEEVTRIVNDYFDTMLSISDSYGGDLLKFGGDALLLFFEGEDGPHRAVATGNDMQQAMDKFVKVETSLGIFPLRMSIGAGTGQVFSANLGTAEKMEYTAMGRTLTNMARAEERAVAGQVMVDQATRDAVQEVATFHEDGDNFWLLDAMIQTVPNVDATMAPETPTTPVMMVMMEEGLGDVWERAVRQVTILDGLIPFVPNELLEQIITNPQQEGVPGSHRPVTVMFANFYGIDELIEALGLNHEAAITKILNAHFATMSQILNRYAGVINKVDAYAIGHRIMALFGALRAREDDVQRSVRAALEMNAALEDVNEQVKAILSELPDLDYAFEDPPLKQRIGLNTGFVFAGNVGSTARHEYSVMGDEVNLTARLMSVAKEGEVLVSQRIHRYLGDAFSLDEKDAVQVKGKTEPVRNFVVTGENEEYMRWANITSSPIVGRDEELQLAKEAVDEAYGGQGRILNISGVSGIGKTRLGEETVLYGRNRGMNLLAGTCLSYGQTMSYHPWVEIWSTYFGISPDDDAQNRMMVIQRALDDIGESDWTPIVAEALHLEMPDNDLTRSLDAKLRQQRLFDLTLKMAYTLAEFRPLMLVIEDIHWADAASMALVEYIARNIQGHPIAILLLYRPDIELPDWTNYPHSVDLTMKDLPSSAALEVVEGMVGQIDLPTQMRDLILEKGGGNPFFIEEVVRALIDTGAFEKDRKGQWQVVQQIKQVELPDTVHGIIISRIDRLLETDQRLLQVASVVGSVFEPTIVEGVYPYGDIDGTIQHHFTHLNHLGLTELDSMPKMLHRFKHLTTREVVYESQSFNQRRGLHRRIAAFIERTSSNALEQADLLAYHYFDGQDWAQALYYNLNVARRAQREFANDTAISAYERALVSAEKLDEDTTVEETIVHEALGEILTLLGRYDEALFQFDAVRTLVLAEPLSNDQYRHLADLARKTAEVYEKRSDYETAFEWLHKGLGYLDENSPTIETARIYLLGAGVYHRQGNNDEALQWSEKCKNIASTNRSFEWQQVAGRTLYLMGTIHAWRGEFQLAEKFCEDSVAAYQDIGDVAGESQAYINLGIAYSLQGDLRKAGDAYRKSLAIKEKIGDAFYQGAVINNLANIYLDQGEWAEAAALFEQGCTIWQRLGAAVPEGITRSNLAQAHIYQKNWRDAKANLTQSEAIFTKLNYEDSMPELKRRWGEFYLETGNLSKALLSLQESIALAISQEAKLEEGMS
ncbi:MAG: adenylate/guanylate cyclase domain-containing protein, partial [Chloroflexota bacterium]